MGLLLRRSVTAECAWAAHLLNPRSARVRENSWPPRNHDFCLRDIKVSNHICAGACCLRVDGGELCSAQRSVSRGRGNSNCSSSAQRELVKI
eukprot:scaffold5200_cov165-Ochromonas_danica.AAC.7